MKSLNKIWLLLGVVFIFSACNSENKKGGNTAETQPEIREENVTYQGDNVNMHGFIAYDENIKGNRPAVLVIPEWWGLNDYIKGRARQLAELGYLAMAIDMYGNGLTADNPDSAGKYAIPFYMNPMMARERFQAAKEKLKSYPQVDTNRIAAIGYCFGGAQVLNVARLGENLKGVVSFHGDLLGVPPHKNLLKAKVLVCHGADDPFVSREQVEKFRKQMDSIGAVYSFKEYDGAVHAFTNPNATNMGKKFNIPIAYNAAADSASWNEMKKFFQEIF